MHVSEGIKVGAAGLGIATATFAGVGGVIGLASGTMASLHEPKDGTADVKDPLKLTAAGVGAMTIGGLVASRGGALGVVGGVTALAGGFVTMLGGLGIGFALAD